MPPSPVNSHRGYQESLLHDVPDLPASLGASLSLLPQQLAQLHVVEAVFHSHVSALGPFPAARPPHHKDDQGIPQDIYGVQGRKRALEYVYKSSWPQAEGSLCGDFSEPFAQTSMKCLSDSITPFYRSRGRPSNSPSSTLLRPPWGPFYPACLCL